MVEWLTDVTLDGGSVAGARGGSFDLGLFPAITHQELTALLVPGYINSVPEIDGWGSPFEFYVDLADLVGTETLAIRSAGRDETVSGNLYSPGSFPVGDDDEDLVWADAVFVRFPVGAWILADDFESGNLCKWSSTTP